MSNPTLKYHSQSIPTQCAIYFCPNLNLEPLETYFGPFQHDLIRTGPVPNNSEFGSGSARHQ
jgi:hypothetical protein